MSAVQPLGAGDLDTRIEILRPVDTDDGLGGSVTTWTVIARPWAEIISQDGREAVIGQALQGVSVYRIRIRYRAGLLASDQIRLGGPGGLDLNMTAPPADPNFRREQLVILASTASARSTA